MPMPLGRPQKPQERREGRSGILIPECILASAERVCGGRSFSRLSSREARFAGEVPIKIDLASLLVPCELGGLLAMPRQCQRAIYHQGRTGYPRRLAVGVNSRQRVFRHRHRNIAGAGLRKHRDRQDEGNPPQSRVGLGQHGVDGGVRWRRSVGAETIREDFQRRVLKHFLEFLHAVSLGGDLQVRQVANERVGFARNMVAQCVIGQFHG